MGAVLYPEAMKTRVGCYEYNEKWPDFHTVHGRRSPSPTARRQDGRKRQLFVMQYIAPSPAGCRCRMARAYFLVDEIVLCNGHTSTILRIGRKQFSHWVVLDSEFSTVCAFLRVQHA